MHFSPAIISFFTASMASATSALASAEAIQEAIGDGCVNTLQFQSTFKTDAGDTCSTCNFCEGSRLSSLFNPKIENVCIECGTADNSCNALEVVTHFENTWLMDFIALSSSSMGSENDPFKIIIKASDNSNTWTTIHDSEVVFAERNNEQLVLLNNDNQYKTYSILFQRKSASAYMYLGQYALVESYTKACTASIYGGITGDTVLAYKTLAPTESPTISGYEFTDRTSLKTAADLWTSNKPQAIQEYGEIKFWQTGNVKDMNYLFYHKTSFNEDLSLWDTSAVTDMESMLQRTAFNANISQWNVDRVETMKYMLSKSRFNGDLSQWNVDSVVNMKGMFQDSPTFNQTLCWDLEEVYAPQIFVGCSGSIGCV